MYIFCIAYKINDFDISSIKIALNLMKLAYRSTNNKRISGSLGIDVFLQENLKIT